MKARTLLIAICTISLVLFFNSCKKYLDVKPDQKFAVPSTLNDLQALSDQVSTLNRAAILTNVFTDEYYLKAEDWSSLDYLNKDGYIWEAQLQAESDWKALYQTIYYANTILDNLQNIPANDQQQRWNNIKGSALFFRAYNFFQLSQIYAPQYDSASFSKDLGIPLRLNSDFNTPSNRATVKETYDRILKDLEDASNLLLDNSQIKTRPTKIATYAMLSRTYLQMGNYTKAKEYADLFLNLNNELLDYNTRISEPSYNPFPIFNANNSNPEIIFYTYTEDAVSGWYWAAKADSLLYSSYNPNDLRKDLFFEEEPATIVGSYSGNAWVLFNGIGTDEIYLIRSECNARLGDVNKAMDDLNTLLSKRWKAGTFVPYNTTSAEDALNKVLIERKKELLTRGLRWSDIRRLNKDSRFAVTLKRILNGETYTLSPSDNRLTTLIPQNVINLSGLQQNKR